MAAVRTSIEWDRLPTTITTEAFKRIKAKVLEAKAASANMDVLVSLPRLRALIGDDAVGDRELLDAVHNLSRHGFVHHLLTPEGEARVLMRPELLNNVASSIVLAARSERNGLGSSTRTLCSEARSASPSWRASTPSTPACSSSRRSPASSPGPSACASVWARNRSSCSPTSSAPQAGGHR